MAESGPKKLPSLVDDEADVELTELNELSPSPPSTMTSASSVRRPYLLLLAGIEVGRAIPLTKAVMIGRSSVCDVQIDEPGVSRSHASVRQDQGGAWFVEDLGSANGTAVNGVKITTPMLLHEGDKINIGPSNVIKFVFLDAVEEEFQTVLQNALVNNSGPSSTRRVARPAWSPESWKSKPLAQAVTYPDAEALNGAVEKLRRLPPLVTSWEVDELKSLIAEAQQGRRFLLQGGDCAETLDDCESTIITNKLKILIQMSLVLIRGSRRPVVRVGRFAGQYAKPRSSPTEKRNGLELPSYFGDLVNRAEFTKEARTPDPNLLLDGYYHAALTLNFIRALSAGGFADLRRPEYFDLSFFERAELPTTLQMDYTRLCREITDGLEFAKSFGDRSADELMRVTFYTSHEGLNLLYEAAQTRMVPRRDGFFDLTTHMPWIGERTRAFDGAHVEFFRGVANPIAVKLGPTVAPDDAIRLCRALNPDNEPGKLVLITRMGVKNVAEKLPPLIAAIERARLRVLWVSDPMHGNAIQTRSGTKTRDFEDILNEIEGAMDVHDRMGTYFGGVHFELTGEDVTECIGGGLTEEDLTKRYSTLCDPRLNYRQAIQMAFCIARRLSAMRRPSSTVPPSR